MRLVLTGGGAGPRGGDAARGDRGLPGAARPRRATGVDRDVRAEPPAGAGRTPHRPAAVAAHRGALRGRRRRAGRPRCPRARARRCRPAWPSCRARASWRSRRVSPSCWPRPTRPSSATASPDGSRPRWSATRLASPEDLVVFVGHAPDELRAQPGVEHVRSIESAPISRDLTRTMRIVFAIGGVGLLAPVVVFVATATRLAAARREQRLAALRLAGATTGQVGVMAAVEALLAAVGGVAVGLGVFLALRSRLARIPLDGASFYPSDLRLSVAAALAVSVAVVALAVSAAVVSLRRIRISPLGVARRAAPGAPDAPPAPARGRRVGGPRGRGRRRPTFARGRDRDRAGHRGHVPVDDRRRGALGAVADGARGPRRRPDRTARPVAAGRPAARGQPVGGLPSHQRHRARRVRRHGVQRHRGQRAVPRRAARRRRARPRRRGRRHPRGAGPWGRRRRGARPPPPHRDRARRPGPPLRRALGDARRARRRRGPRHRRRPGAARRPGAHDRRPRPDDHARAVRRGRHAGRSTGARARRC